MSVSDTIAARVAVHLRPGEIVNLGIGIPTLVADHLPSGVHVVLETENGMLGVGPSPASGQEDPDLINASKLPVTELPGASYFSSSASFAMIRGGHVDTAILGVLQVDEQGRVANWSLPGRPILGVGGAMDLIAGAGRIIVATTHLTKDGEPKIVASCDFPLSAQRHADLVVTEHATFETDEEGLVLVEVSRDCTAGWVAENTGARYRVADALEALGPTPAKGA